MAILKIKPSTKDYLWGGHRLVDEYGIEHSGDICAEAWLLSCHKDGPSYIDSGEYKGKTLKEYIDDNKNVLGKNCERFEDFPVLIKFIDAKDDLSIQVHPDDEYALANEGQYGKTEMWYVLDALEDCSLIYGLNKEISKEEFKDRILNNTLIDVVDRVKVNKGDTFFIKPGTLHAIGKGLLVLEVQQNSNITYRIYDYDRADINGNKRELHIDKALEVTNLNKVINEKNDKHLAECDYFITDKVEINGEYKGFVSDDCFLSIVVIDGKGTIKDNNDTIEFKKGNSLFLPAGTGEYIIEGNCVLLFTTIK